VFTGNPYWLRDLTEKLTRRVKKLIGRADPAPWVVRPAGPPRAAAVTISGLAADSPLVSAMHDACSPRGVAVHLFPDARPFSVQVDGLTLGPLNRDAALAKLRDAGIDLVPTPTGPRPGDGVFARAYCLLGDQTLVWPSRPEPRDPDDLHRYEPITWADVRAHGLTQAFDLTDRVRRATGVEFFSLDLCVINGHLLPVGFGEDAKWTKIPPLLTWFCERVADRAGRPHRGGPMTPGAGHGVWLPRADAPTTAPMHPALLGSLIDAA
jgi:hypothetical protein